MCVTDHHDMTLAVKVALNPNTANNQSHDNGGDKDILYSSYSSDFTKNMRLVDLGTLSKLGRQNNMFHEYKETE